jgi:hypothetical protein
VAVEVAHNPLFALVAYAEYKVLPSGDSASHRGGHPILNNFEILVYPSSRASTAEPPGKRR